MEQFSELKGVIYDNKIIFQKNIFSIAFVFNNTFGTFCEFLCVLYNNTQP